VSDLGDTARRATEAPRAVASQGVGNFVGAVLLRFRAADGTTHVRALGYQMMFVAISGFIGLVGLASALDIEQLRGVATELGRSLAPGPSGQILQQTIRQGSSQGWTAAVVGLFASAVAGTLAMAQLERSANRIAGSNDDRPGVRRYVRAAILALTVGVLFVLGTLIAVGGSALAEGFGWRGTTEQVWVVARWPFGAAVILVATYLLFLHAPRERLGEHRTLLWGAVVSLALWAVFSAGLAVYFSMRADSGQNPYGPLLAVIALLLWSMLSSLAFHLGLATMCELAGKKRPVDGDVVRLPDATQEREAPAAIPSPP
jgi:uncharacterized BrkB/YihY/UPF0761 family membrane protein